MNCGPWHIQSIHSSAYSGFNIQLNVSALPLEICRVFSERYTANIVPNTSHILQITQCDLWSRPYTMYLQFHIFRLQYSTKRSSAAILDISTIQRALYCKLGAKYNAHTSVYAMWTVWSPTYTMQLQLRIFSLQYSTETTCAAIGHMQRFGCALHCKLGAEYSAPHPFYAMWTCGPAQIQCSNSTAYSGFNIQQKVSAL
jgi:hypothetical protein